MAGVLQSWQPDFSEASPNGILGGGNPMAVDRMGILSGALQGAAARYRAAQPVGSDPTYLHDVGLGYAGPLGGMIGDLITPPNLNSGDPWRDGMNAGIMFSGIGGPGIRAYHGSPHDFDRFDMSKIGTGEGAQVYGHGLYFAENPAVAETYKDLGRRMDRPVEGMPGVKLPNWIANKLDAGEDIHPLITEFRNRLAQNQTELAAGTSAQPWLIEDRIRAVQSDLNAMEAIAAKRAKLGAPGRGYEVSINADPEHFLDWDKPLSEQPKAVQEAVAKSGIYPGATAADIAELGVPGEHVYHRGVAEKVGSPVLPGSSKGDAPVQVTEALRAAGIKGIRYKDAESRNVVTVADIETAQQHVNIEERRVMFQKPGAEKSLEVAKQRLADLQSRLGKPGTSNYVVFDDRIIDILKKYGIAGLTGGAGAALAMQQPKGGT